MSDKEAPTPPTTTDAVALATSTAASGPAGSHFEGQIGAFYLML